MSLDGKTDLTARVIGAAIEVHKHLGAGFKEKTYENALMIELRLQGISAERQLPVELDYKDESIGEGVIDILVEGTLVVELKAIDAIHDAHKNQVLAYLKAIDQPVGLLLNFHAPRMAEGVRRVVNEAS